MRLIFGTLLIILLIACGESERNNERLKDTVIGDELEVMEKAKNLDKEMQDALNQKAKEIDEQAQ